MKLLTDPLLTLQPPLLYLKFHITRGCSLFPRATFNSYMSIPINKLSSNFLERRNKQKIQINNLSLIRSVP